jgi:hypothetical protein
MGIRFVIDEPRRKVALFDSTSGFAFGPVLEDEDEAEAFVDFAEIYAAGLGWEQHDPRAFTSRQLEDVYAAFLESNRERER